jgi:hypothetical protein
MGNSQPTANNATARPTITTDIQRICVAGINYSPPCGRSRKVASLIASKYPLKYETWFYFDSSSCFDDFLVKTFGKEGEGVTFPKELKGHSTAPFVWVESKGEPLYLGQNVTFLKWAKETFPEDKEICDLAAVEWSYADALHHQCCIQATVKLDQVKGTDEVKKVEALVTNK